MKNQTLTKAQLREVRQLTGLAYERELTRATEALRLQFETWRRGELDVFALNEKIHEFHDDIARELYKRYSDRHDTSTLSSAIARGVIAENEVPPAILENLRDTINFCKTG